MVQPPTRERNPRRSDLRDVTAKRSHATVEPIVATVTDRFVGRQVFRRGVAMVFQDLAPWPNLSIFGNVKLRLAGHKLSLGGRLASRVLGPTRRNNRLLTAVVACRWLKSERLI